MSPNLRFEFPATWPAPILATASPRVPLNAPRPGWGEGVTFAARRGREVAHSQATKISKPNRFAYPFRSRPRGVRKERGGPLFSIWHRPRRLVIEIRQIWGSVSPPVPVVTRTISGQESPIAVASLTSGAGFCWQRGAHLTWPRCGSRRVSQNRSGSAPQLGWRRRFP